MTYAQTFDKRLVILELDGAVVHDHTPSDLILAGFPLEPERYEQALDLIEAGWWLLISKNLWKL
jgi:hypothetical protein